MNCEIFPFLKFYFKIVLVVVELFFKNELTSQP